MTERLSILAGSLALFSCLAFGSAQAQTPAPDDASASGTGAQFASSNETATVDCAGGGAEIAGSSNKLTLTGGCKTLQMLGSNNKITVALAKGASIEFVGSNNQITWSAADGKKPTVSGAGSNNSLIPGK